MANLKDQSSRPLPKPGPETNSVLSKDSTESIQNKIKALALSSQKKIPDEATENKENTAENG